MSTNICQHGVSGLMRERELTALLFNISTNINSSVDFEEIMQRVLMESATAICSEASGIALREDNQWLIRYAHNLPQELRGKTFSDEQFPGASAAMKTNKTAAVVDDAHEERTGHELMKAFGAGAVLAVPLTVRSKIIGCLFFNYLSAKRTFNDNELKFAESAAALISLVLENARLVEERERLIGQVNEEQARFDAVLEEMPAGVIIAEAPTLKLIRGNRQVERIWREPFLKAVEAGDYTVYKGFHPDGRPYQPEEWPLARSIMKGEMVTGEEISILRGDGTEGAISVSSAPIRDIRGRIIAGAAIFNDVSERRQAEEAVRDSESKFRNIASAAQDAVILIDNNGMVAFWNDAATKIFGYSSEEMTGKLLHSFIMPERYYKEHIKGFEAFRTTGQGRFIGKTYEIEAKRKDGTEFPVELSLAALKLKEKWNSIGIVRDITARKRAEEELKQAVAGLERSNLELQQFAYAASHDLQEPLRTIASFIELLQRRYKGKLDEKADRYISFAIQGTKRMYSLIDDLLAYSRVGTKGKQFAPVKMDFVLKQAMENLQRSIRENKAKITTDSLPEMQGDNTQLVQLLQNLIGNAIKFGKKDKPPRIHISAERKGSEWVFGVHDNGIGLDPRFHERIFAIFQRLHTREEYPGTGVGLAICKKIVERHGGRIWVESKAGEGASFYFTMPARYGENKSAAQLSES